jgi:hypothetical protein
LLGSGDDVVDHSTKGARHDPRSNLPRGNPGTQDGYVERVWWQMSLIFRCRMWRQSVLRVLLVAALLARAARGEAQTTSLTLNSQPGDFIGQGQSVTLTPNDGTFTARQNSPNSVSIFFLGFQLGSFWSLDFAAPQGVPLNVGTYQGATRFPFEGATTPGLDVSGDGRGCNTLTGQFEVSQVAVDGAGNVTSFAADFEQHCEGSTAALFGSIRINAGPIAQRCRSTVTTFPGLEALVRTSNSSAAAKYTLIAVLERSQTAFQAGHAKLARQWMVAFLEQVAAGRDRGDHHGQQIDSAAVDPFICAASNLLVNMTDP